MSNEEPASHLNSRQEAFCREYLIDLNATQAYIRAGYSEEGAGQAAHNLLKNTEISNRIAKLQADRAKRLEIDADKVLAEISRLAFSDIRNITNEGDSLLRLRQIDDDTAAAIQSVKVTTKKVGFGDEAEYEDVTEYRLADKKGPLEMLAKHLGELTDKIEISGLPEVRIYLPDNARDPGK